MPFVDIQLIAGVFSDDEKRQMIEKVTDTMVAIEGEALRGVTWVRIQETASGEWGIGGRPLSTADVKALRAGGS
jgi:4-oxalocrotonate tautomerase